MVRVNFGGTGTRLRKVHCCNKENTNLQSTNNFEKNKRLVLFTRNIAGVGWAESSESQPLSSLRSLRRMCLSHLKPSSVEKKKS